MAYTLQSGYEFLEGESTTKIVLAETRREEARQLISALYEFKRNVPIPYERRVDFLIKNMSEHLAGCSPAEELVASREVTLPVLHQIDIFKGATATDNERIEEALAAEGLLLSELGKDDDNAKIILESLQSKLTKTHSRKSPTIPSRRNIIWLTGKKGRLKKSFKLCFAASSTRLRPVACYQKSR